MDVISVCEKCTVADDDDDDDDDDDEEVEWLSQSDMIVSVR